MPPAVIRDVVKEDIPWVLDVARVAYKPLIPDFQEEGARHWLEACLVDPTVIFLRGIRTVAIAAVMRVPWTKELACDLMQLFALPGGRMEPVAIVREVARRARAMGGARMFLGSVFADLTPIARRLGARTLSMSYVLELADV